MQQEMIGRLRPLSASDAQAVDYKKDSVQALLADMQRYFLEVNQPSQLEVPKQMQHLSQPRVHMQLGPPLLAM